MTDHPIVVRIYQHPNGGGRVEQSAPSWADPAELNAAVSRFIADLKRVGVLTGTKGAAQ